MTCEHSLLAGTGSGLDLAGQQHHYHAQAAARLERYRPVEGEVTVHNVRRHRMLIENSLKQ